MDSRSDWWTLLYAEPDAGQWISQGRVWSVEDITFA
jgi:hypothetical protein